MSNLTRSAGWRAMTLTAAVVALGAGVAVVGLTNGSSSSPSAGRAPSSPSPASAPDAIQSPGQNGPSSTAQRLRETELERLGHLVAADVDQAAPLHADDFELIPPPGYPQGRDDYLAAVETGDLDYHEFEPTSDIEVRVHGTSAVLWYESRIDITAAGLGRFSHDTWHLYYYERRAGTWQVVREQATAVGGFPPGT